MHPAPGLHRFLPRARAERMLKLLPTQQRILQACLNELYDNVGAEHVDSILIFRLHKG